jgi:DNA repair protein REV1
MDCFFASVVLRNFPEHRDKPVAISHQGRRSSSSGGGRGGGGSEYIDPSEVPIPKNSTSECATCNYKARDYGVKKGMFLGRAKQLCPELVVLQYDFDGYEEVTGQVMEILYRVASEHDGVVEAVSCDEAYMELHIENADGNAETCARELAETIRLEIFETTQCTASIGVSTNKFLAKLGTDQVKPNGSFVVQDYKKLLDNLKLRDLHGIGWRSEPKLTSEGLVEVRDVWDLGHRGEATLSRILGPGLGRRVFMYCQGEDDRQVKPAERKTIGAEVRNIAPSETRAFLLLHHLRHAHFCFLRLTHSSTV